MEKNKKTITQEQESLASFFSLPPSLSISAPPLPPLPPLSLSIYVYICLSLSLSLTASLDFLPPAGACGEAGTVACSTGPLSTPSPARPLWDHRPRPRPLYRRRRPCTAEGPLPLQVVLLRLLLPSAFGPPLGTADVETEEWTTHESDVSYHTICVQQTQLHCVPGDMY